MKYTRSIAVFILAVLLLAGCTTPTSDSQTKPPVETETPTDPASDPVSEPVDTTDDQTTAEPDTGNDSEAEIVSVPIPDTDISSGPAIVSGSAIVSESGITSGSAVTEESKEPFTFENTLFIGDSRTEGLLLNTGLTEATFYAVRGLSVSNIYTKEFLRTADSSEKITIMKALEGKQFRKIYLMLGVNELGWASDQAFIDCYAKLIGDIQTLQPEAEIVIQSILPVTKEKSDNDDIYNNENIYRFNGLIQTMTEELDVIYADLVPAVAAEDGSLPADGAADGVHLTKSYYQKWLDYLTANEI